MLEFPTRRKPEGCIVISKAKKEQEIAKHLLEKLKVASGHFITAQDTMGHDAFFYDPDRGTWTVGRTNDVLTLCSNLLASGKFVSRAVVKSEEGDEEEDFHYIPLTAGVSNASVKCALQLARTTVKPQFVPGLAFRNGFLRCDPVARRFDFVPHSPTNWAFSRIEKDWQDIVRPESQIPQTLKMRTAVLSEDGRGDENWNILISCIALGAFGLGKQANAFLTIYGEGGNGKSTLIEALLRRAVEDYARDVASVDMCKLDQPFVVHQLIGRKFNFRNEMDDKTISNACCQIQKSLAEGTAVSIRKMHTDEFSLELPVMCIYLSNNEVQFADSSKGFARRHYHIKMEADLLNSGLSRDDILLSVEGEQIAYLNYLKQHVEQFWAAGHIAIPRSKEAEEEASSTVLNFVRDCVRHMLEPSESNYMSLQEFKEIYYFYHHDIVGSRMATPDAYRIAKLLALESRKLKAYNPHKGHKLRLRPQGSWSGIAKDATPSPEMRSLLLESERSHKIN